MLEKPLPLVSVVIPTLNNDQFINACLRSIFNQAYKQIEVIVVDGFSRDKTVTIVNTYNVKFYQYGPKQSRGRVFGAPFQRNFGAAKAKGTYIYYVDADMILSKQVIESAVKMCQKDCDAVIVPEDSFGIGFWAACKQLERRAYWGDDNVEAPRFIRRKVWRKLGGLDDTLGADDWDMHDRLKQAGYKIGRTDAMVRHNEGQLSLRKLIRKRYLYGRSIKKYITTQTSTSTRHFFPIRKGFITHWYLFVKDPLHAAGFIFMRTLEYAAGLAGIISTLIKPQRVDLTKA